MKLVKTTILFFILFLTFFVTQKVYASNHTLSESDVNELISKANENDITSQITLSDYYYDLEKYEDSFNWIKKAAELGDPVAQNNLGYMYDNGLGTVENKKLAYRWFKKAAEQNQVNALTTIATAKLIHVLTFRQNHLKLVFFLMFLTNWNKLKPLKVH